MESRRPAMFPVVFVGLVGLFLAGLFFGYSVVLRGQTAELPPQTLAPGNDDVAKPPPTMDSRIFEWIRRYETEGPDSARAYAREQQLEMDANDSIRFVVEFDHRAGASPTGLVPQSQLNARREAVTRLIEELGGRVETTHDVRIQAYLGANGLRRLAGIPYVRFVRPPMKPVPLVVSEGVDRVGAREWQQAQGYHVTGMPRVAVLDLGFTGYRSLKGSELPHNVVTKAFHRYGIEGDGVHGTACAEIVYDMAPGLPKLWLVNFDSDVNHSKAVDYLIQQGVDVISNSIGWINAGAGDGTGPINEDVNRAVQAGISWVVAVGNEAQRHWEGVFKDTDGDRYFNYQGADELLLFEAKGASCVFVNWDDWGRWDGMNYSGSDQDYDLYIYKWSSVWGWWRYTWSLSFQNGTQWPIEAACVSTPGIYGIAIKKFFATRNVKIEMFLTGNLAWIEQTKAAGSITIPADSKVALTVGAVDWSDDSYHTYSSRGPTADGRIKPDLVAPSGVANVTYERFYGTSAAAPHVAGALALLKMKTPFTMRQLEQILLERALELGPTGPDNRFGQGRLKLTP